MQDVKTSAKAGEAIVATRLLDLLPRLLGEIRREIAAQEPGELTLAQFRILCQLQEDPSSNNKSLASNTGVSVAATSRMVDGLVERGFVARNRDTKDKRQCSLRLTEAGEFQCADFRKVAEKAIQRILHGLRSDDSAMIARSLDLLIGIFSQKALGRA
jgi:MarR family multiple antibiotic resistance transcriptional regulator